MDKSESCRWGIAFPLVASFWLVISLPALAAGGDLDGAFSGDGRVVTDFALERGEGVAVGADGKVIVAGWTTAGVDGTDPDFGVVKYTSAGVLDPSFGGDGLVTTDFPVPSGAPDSVDSGYDVALQGERIAVAGQSDGRALAVAVYRDTDGALDLSFSGDGMLQVPALGVEVSGVAFQPDGKVVVVGTFRDETGFTDFVVLRFRSGGGRDRTFSDDGLVLTDLSPFDSATDVAVQSDGRIVVVGSAVVRYTDSGTLDTSFGGDGVGDPPELEINGAAIAPDGKIIVAGWTVLNNTQDWVVGRYRKGGRIDRQTATSDGFSGDGRIVVNFGGRDRAEAVAVQGNGKPVAVGNSSGNWAIARFLARGELDLSFSLDGKLIHGMGVSTLDIAQGVAIARDGKIVAGGWAGRDFGAARYLA